MTRKVENYSDFLHPLVMRIAWLWVGTFAVALSFGGCNSAPPLPPVPATAPKSPDHPQAKLATVKLWLGAQEMVAEQAIRPKEIETGMMFRKEMGEQEGMLFVFPGPSRVGFWMRNTLLPLSCAYIDRGGVILEIHDMQPLDETPIEAGSDQIQYVLETKQGWFERNHVAVGMVIRTERGSLAETYFGRK